MVRGNAGKRLRKKKRREEVEVPSRRKMMEFYHYEEYLTSVSKKILLWQCREKQVFIQLIYAD